MKMWSPSGLDKVFLSPASYAEAKKIGQHLYERLCAEWSAEKIRKILNPDPDYNSYLEKKEEYRILVCAYMAELPVEDADLLAYNKLHETHEECDA